MSHTQFLITGYMASDQLDSPEKEWVFGTFLMEGGEKIKRGKIFNTQLSYCSDTVTLPYSHADTLVILAISYTVVQSPLSCSHTSHTISYTVVQSHTVMQSHCAIETVM